MRKSKVLILFFFFLITGCLLLINGNLHSGNAPNNNIKVYVRIGGDPVEGAYVRIDGPGFLQCGTTPANGELLFQPSSSGNYTACASKNGWSKSQSFYLSTNYDVWLYLENDNGACVTCPGGK
jgi:hypothetical protein